MQTVAHQIEPVSPSPSGHASQNNLRNASPSSHDSDLVRNLKSVMSLGEHNVSLLESLWRDQCVNSLYLDVVQLTASLSDGWLSGSLVHLENESVVIFNGLDCSLTTDWVLDDGVLVPGRFLLHTSSWGEWLASNRQGFWSAESNFVPNLRSFLGMSAFLHVFGSLFGLLTQNKEAISTIRLGRA